MSDHSNVTINQIKAAMVAVEMDPMYGMPSVFPTFRSYPDEPPGGNAVPPFAFRLPMATDYRTYTAGGSSGMGGLRRWKKTFARHFAVMLVTDLMAPNVETAGYGPLQNDVSQYELPFYLSYQTPAALNLNDTCDGCEVLNSREADHMGRYYGLIWVVEVTQYVTVDR